MAKRKSLTEAADKELKTAFSLDKFKANKGLASNVKFKEQKWIPFSFIILGSLHISQHSDNGTKSGTTPLSVKVNLSPLGSMISMSPMNFTIKKPSTIRR